MNAQPKPPPPPPPGRPPGWINLTALADRIEKHVRWYFWLTAANVIVFGVNAVFLLVLFIANYLARH